MNPRAGFLLLVALALLGWAVPSGAQPVVSPRTSVARQLVELWRVGIARARRGDASYLLGAANPSGGLAHWRVADLLAAVDELLDDRVFDPNDPMQYVAQSRCVSAGSPEGLPSSRRPSGRCRAGR